MPFSQACPAEEKRGVTSRPTPSPPLPPFLARLAERRKGTALRAARKRCRCSAIGILVNVTVQVDRGENCSLHGPILRCHCCRK
jgi:hypothetical protein